MKNKKLGLAKIICGILCACALIAIVIPKQASARISEKNSYNDIKKALMDGVYQCYINVIEAPGAIKGTDVYSFSGNIGDSSDDYITLPTNLTNIEDNNISCYRLFFGDENASGERGTFEGVLALGGNKKWYDDSISMDNKRTLLSNFGFSKTGQVKQTKCFNFVYNGQTWSPGRDIIEYGEMHYGMNGRQICVESDNTITIGAMPESTDTTLVYNLSMSEPYFVPYSANDQNGVTIKYKGCSLSLLNDGEYVDSATVIYNPGETIEDFEEKVKNQFITDCGSIMTGTGEGGKFNIVGEVYSDTNEDESENYSFAPGEFGQPDRRTAANKAIKYIFGENIITFSKEEKIRLLAAEIKETYYSGIPLNQYWICGNDVDTNVTYKNFTTIKTDSKAQGGKCRIDQTGVLNKNDKIVGFNNSNMFDTTGKVTYDLGGAIEEINRLYDSMTEAEKDTLGSATDNTGGYIGGGSTTDDTDSSATAGSGDGETDACYSGSGAMGWIICPVTAAVSGVGNWAWEIIEKNFLVIDTNGLFGNSGVNSAWGTIRDIANIAFIIVVLVIIFSQLTGVGIDNYGIKKMLPKIIVAAVLVNLSLIICQLCVEVSNIVGQSVRSWLTNLAPTAGAGMGAVGSGMLGVALGAGGMGLYALLNGTTLGGAFAALGLAVLGIVIVIVFAILVLYIILVIREAGVVLLIIISPIALTCRILPNTEKLYKKWFDLFKAVLVVYPLCSFMIGAGQLAGSILSQLDSSSMKVAAMVVQVVPFILIPSLLKSSLSLMGNIGNKISGWGRGLGRGAKRGVNRGITNSQGYKRMTDGFNLKKASKYDNRMQKRMRKGKNLSNSQQAKLAQARSTILKSQSDQINNEQMSRNDMYGYMSRQQENKAESDRIKVRSDVMSQKGRGDFKEEDNAGILSEAIRKAPSEGNIEEVLAAIDTMEAAGYNKEMLGALKKGGLEHLTKTDQQRVFARLSGSKDAVLQAYGKEQLKAMDNGETVKSLADFMSGSKNDGNTMAAYLDAKGNGILNGQNDDTIKFIMDNDSAGHIMTDSDIISVARNPKDNKVTSAIIKSLKSRGGLQQEISASQLADIKSMDMFNAMVPTDADIDRVLGTAIKDMANDRSNKLLSNLDPEIRKVIQAKVDAIRGGSVDTTYYPEDE